MLGCFLGLGSFDSHEGFLIHKQAPLPITFSGVELISTFTIARTSYLRSWALVTSVIVVKFMVYQRPFLFEALARIDTNTFLFQQHLKVACDLLPPPARACLLPFEQLIGQQMVQLQGSISKHLHHHTFSNMLFDETSKAHHAQILSCFGPGVSAWLIVRPIFTTFQLSPPIFYTTFCMCFGLPSITGIPRCVCTHPIDPMGIHFLCCAHGNKKIGTHDVICNTFVTIA